MDQFAFHDIPDSIDYVLATTSQPSLSYVGFSQGTAQAFATLSIHPTLNDKIDVFIALAPAMSPAGLRNGVVDSLVKASPEVLFLAFGRRSILSSATMWQSILYPPIFVRILDMSLSFLFNWSGRNITYSQKLAAYPHLYSFTSTKCVVHWFQIIRNKSFQMYDDDVQTPLGLGASDRYYKVAKFPTRNIKTPVVLIYGGSDSLVDIKVMLKELPRHTTAKEVPHYEHLDFLWGQEVESLVFPHVFESLTAYAGRDHMYSSTVLYGNRRQKRLVLGEDSEDDYSSPANDDMTELNAEANRNRARYDDARVTPSPKKRSPSSFIDQKSLLSSSSTEHNSASADGSSDLGQAGSKTDSVFGRNRKYTNKRNKSIIRATSNGSTKKVSEGGIALGAGKATTGIINSPSPPSRNMDRTLKRTS